MARAVVSKPKLLILDEPSNALDIDAKESFYKATNTLNESGVTIMVISHDFSMINEDCAHLMYLNKDIKYYGRYEDIDKTSLLFR